MRRRKQPKKKEKQPPPLAVTPITPREEAALPPANLDDRKVVRLYSRVEYRRILQIVEAAMMQGFGVDRVRDAVRGEFPTVGKGYCQKRMSDVHQKWQEEDVASHESWKSAQIRRIMGYMRHAQGEQRVDPGTGLNTWVREPNHAALAKWESLLADIQGTRAPIEIKSDGQVREALIVVLGRMDADQADALLARAEQEKTLAEAARRAGIVEMPVEAPQLPAGSRH